jgi:hypothetical protein
LTASNATGSIPFNVTFHATGSDADGDSLTYSLSFGDGTAASTGTALPADIVHQYSVVGNFTAKLTVGDGKSEVNTTALVAATAAAAAGGPQVVTGSWISGGPIACEQFLDGDDLHQMADQTGDFDWVQFDVRADTIDKAFKATLEPVGAPGGGFEIDFYDAGGSNLGYFDSAPPDGLTIEGTVPASAAIGILFVCTPGPGDFTYTAG